MQIPKIIEKNPFRILGVCSNSAKREIIANKNKMLAFARLNKSVSFPMDMNVFMPPPERSQEDLRKAEADINLPKDKIKFAFFWFINLTESDKQALDQLSKGSVGPAENIWRSRRGASAYINLACLSLLQNNVTNFLRFTNLVLSNGEECFTFLQAIGCGSEQIDISQLIDTILSELHNNVEEDVLIDAVEELDDETFLEKLNTLLTKSSLPLIEKELRLSDGVQLDDANRAYAEGQRLFNTTSKEAKRIKAVTKGRIVSVNLILDKLSERISECVLAYFHASFDPSTIEKVSHLMSFAQAIAVSDEQQNKTRDAFNTLKEEAEVIPFMMQLREANESFENSSKSYFDICSYLDRAIAILGTLAIIRGHNSELVRGSSTGVTRIALNAAIGNLNNSIPKSQEAIARKVMDGSVEEILDQTKKIINRLEPLNMDDDCRDWLQKNKNQVQKDASSVALLRSTIENKSSNRESSGSGIGCLFWIIVLVVILIAVNH